MIDTFRIQRLPIEQNLRKLRSDIIQIIRHQQRCGQNCPHSHLCTTLFNAQTEIAQQQHIRIVPCSRSGIRRDPMLFGGKVLRNGFHRIPRIIDVAPVSPQIAMLFDECEVRLRRE